MRDGTVQNTGVLLDDGRRFLKISNELSLDGNPVVNSAGEVVGLTMSGYVNGDFAFCAVPSAQISAIPQKTAKKLSEVAAEYDEYVSEQDNTDDLTIQYEKEPNNLEEDANLIKPGFVYGTTDEQILDLYRIQCNSSGYIYITVISNNGNVHDLAVFVKNALNPTDKNDWHVASKETISDGTKAQFLRIRIENPTSYYLSVFTPEENISAINYSILYEFLPD